VQDARRSPSKTVVEALREHRVGVRHVVAPGHHEGDHLEQSVVYILVFYFPMSYHPYACRERKLCIFVGI
jgi:hypothetical protein